MLVKFVVSELAAIDRIRQEVTIVNDRMNDRLLTFLELGIIRVLNVEVITAGVEAVTFASACQINLIGLDVVLVAFQAVGTRKLLSDCTMASQPKAQRGLMLKSPLLATMPR